MRFFSLLANLHGAFFGTLERLLMGWFIELSARFVFCSVLLLYFVNSAWLKAGESVFGFLTPGTVCICLNPAKHYGTGGVLTLLP